jgi:crotonobetainyl-CoA:carnitine CoA-transferase CaiB-like acyl-CoA transferase
MKNGGYDFLDGVIVLEVSQLGPDAVGGHLADLGAQVIKLEPPGEGDPIRYAGAHAVGHENGFGLLHLRWNRGKKSVGLDLRTKEGAAIFKKLAANADLIIEGLRAGALERLGLGYEALSAINSRIVFCAVSGLGSTGPYRTLGSGAPSFDMFAGLHGGRQPPESYASSTTPLIGVHATGLHGALAAVAAIWRSWRTGRGCLIELAATDEAACWLPDGLDVALNKGSLHRRPDFADQDGRLLDWPRMELYRTKDNRVLFLQVLKPKFWERLCRAIGRLDLLDIDDGDRSATNERVWRELTGVFRTRPLSEWMDLFIAADVPALPANTVEELAEDPQFRARGNVYEAVFAGGEQLRLTGTPLKVSQQSFTADLAPTLGQHTDQVMIDLGFELAAIAKMRSDGIIA